MANVIVDARYIARELTRLVYEQLRASIPDLRIIDVGEPANPRRPIPDSLLDAAFNPQQASATDGEFIRINSRDLLRNMDAFSARFLEDPATKIARKIMLDHSAGKVLLSITPPLPMGVDAAALCSGYNLCLRVIRAYEIDVDLFTWRFDALYAFVNWPAETATLSITDEVAA